MDSTRSNLSGKADGLVYVHFNGGVYTRKLPIRKKDAWTPGMLLNEQRFKQINAFCSLFKDSVIPQIWNGMDSRMSGYALFLKTNKSAFATDGTIEDAKKIKLSTGSLSFPEGFQARRSELDESLVEVSWPRELTVGGVHLKDELMVISCVEGQYSEINSTGIRRNDLGGTFALPDIREPQAPGPMLLYLFFASTNHREYSESMYFEV